MVRNKILNVYKMRLDVNSFLENIENKKNDVYKNYT